VIAFGYANGASALPLVFEYNGTAYSFPFTANGAVVGPNSSTAGHVAIWNNSAGTLLADGGALAFSNLSGSLACSQAPALTGNVTTSAGSCSTTIASGAVSAADLASGAASSNIGTLSGDLSGSTLPATTIAAGVVTGSKIASATITDSNFVANTIQYDSLATALGGTVVGNPTASTANKQDMAMPSCSNTLQTLQWLAGTGFQCATLSVTVPTSPVRQTVAGGPVLLSGGAGPGAPSFLPSTAASLNLTTQNISSSYPLAVTAADGFGASGPVDTVGVSTSNLTWSGLTGSSTLYLYVTVNANGTLTAGFTSSAPVYEFGGAPSATLGQFTFNIGEMRGYMGNGSSAPQANIVFVGQAVTGSSTITSTIAYAYNGYYDSGFTATLPSSSSYVSATSNIGVADVEPSFLIQCTTTNQGYAQGDEIVFKSATVGNTAGSNVAFPYTLWANALSVGFATSSSSTNVFVVSQKTGTNGALTAADWEYKFIVRRTWGGAGA
jgi:hypothetical protein